MKIHARAAVTAIALLAAMSGFSHPAIAQAEKSAPSFPTRPVRMIVPFAAGGSSDLVARVMGQRLAALWGQQVVVDNRPGASGMLGHEIGARAPADGHTILITAIGPLAVNPTLFRKLAYDPLKSFAPVTMTVSLVNTLVIHPSVPAKSVREFIDHARSRPGQITYGSSGIGGAGHLAGELLNIMADTKLSHIAYKGGAPAMIDLVGGQIHMIFATFVTALPHIKSGKIRALAVTTKERAPIAPELPTVSEAALPGFEANNWDGLLVPAGTPAALTTRLSRDIGQVLAIPEVKELLTGQGALPMPTTPAAFADYIKSEIAKWGDVVRRAGIRAE